MQPSLHAQYSVQCVCLNPISACEQTYQHIIDEPSQRPQNKAETK